MNNNQAKKFKNMTTSECEKSHWERSSRNTHLLMMVDAYLIAKINYSENEKNWEIQLYKRYSENALSPQIQEKDIRRAQKFTVMILGEGIIENPDWQKLNQYSFQLHDSEGEILAFLNFNKDTKRWHSKVLRRDYVKTLSENIKEEQVNLVKKFTEELAGAEPYEYLKLSTKFERSVETSNINK
jgi:hypothetical protein